MSSIQQYEIDRAFRVLEENERLLNESRMQVKYMLQYRIKSLEEQKAMYEELLEERGGYDENLFIPDLSGYEKQPGECIKVKLNVNR